MKRGLRAAITTGVFAASLFVGGCEGERPPAASVPPSAKTPEGTMSPEFESATSFAVPDGISTVVALREPSKPLDADAVGNQLLEQLRSGVPLRVLETFTEDLTIAGGAGRIFGSGPAPRQILSAMVNYPGELKELSGLRFRDLRLLSRRAVQESTGGFLGAASKSLPSALPGELLLVANVDSPSRVLFPSRARVLLLLRETLGSYRIRAIVDE